MPTPTLSEFEFEIGARIGRGDWSGAAAAAAGCRVAWPSERAGWLLGSIAALFADQKETALTLVQERLASNPDDVQCLLQQAECLLALGRRAAAIAAADAAAVCAGKIAAALDAVGEFLVHADEHRRALEIYDRAVEAAPHDPSIRAKRAAVHRFVGNFSLAESDYDAILAISPADAEALWQKSDLSRQTSDSNSVAALEAALKAAPGGSKETSILHLGLAKSYEDLGHYTESWRHLSAGNTLERSRIQYDPEQDRAVIDRIIEAFPTAEITPADTTGERPIFILGLPRTGTTLVDRILGNHSQVHSAGELSALSEAIGIVVQRIAWPKPTDWRAYAATLGALDGGSIAREYLERSRARRGERPRFTDKQPANFFYCGLILRAFPNARIVHLTRHPLAACYAIYKTRFRGAWPFSYDLAELGAFYLGYRRLMAHWHRVLPGRILDVAYEDLVTAQEPTTRRLLEDLELPFEDACLEFHLNPAPVTTASSVQVRQPLYDSSLHQWEHFAAQLAPLRARLEAAGIRVDQPV
jgi:tetratricopeptide (TPR) repeat protein